MFKNYLRVAFRNLFKNRVFSIINILGLAIGMAAFVLIIQYVRFELSYDNFHDKGENIYRIQQDRYNKGELTTQWAAGCSAVGQALFENFREVEDFTRFQKLNGIITVGEEKFREENIYLADTSFFEIFSFKIIEGDFQTGLDNPMEVFLSASTAQKYFGDNNPIGESLSFNGGVELIIRGLFEDIPVNSHLKPDIIVSWETIVQFNGKEINTAWQWDGYFNYILLNPASDYHNFEDKIALFVEDEIGEGMDEYGAGVEFHLQPLRSIHLNSDFMFEAEKNGNSKSVYALMVIAFFLIVIAWINYINLAGSRSLERAREVGMRKVLGAGRNQITGQFLLESLIINILAILFAIAMVFLFSPYFNQLTGERLDYSFRLNPVFWLTIMLIFLTGSFISGIYPALFLSSFKPTTVFRGITELKLGGVGMRRVLVIFQFATSFLLLAGTLTVYKQISFMKGSDLGIDISNVLVLKGPGINDTSYSETFTSFKEELLRNPDIEKLTASLSVPGRQPQWNAGGIRKLSEGPENSNQYRIVGFDYNFVDFYGLKIVEGRNFSEEYGRNSETVLLNESASRLMGFEDYSEAMNVPIYFWGDTFNIVGIVKDYHQEGLQTKEEPLIFRFYRDASGYYSVKYNPLKTSEVIQFLDKEWEVFFSKNPFEYFFLEDYYNEQYKNEMRFGKVFGIFAFIAIFIAGLGLFGLSSYTTFRRSHEIGLRKALGSSTWNAILILLKYFYIQVLIAVPLGLIPGFYLMRNWLNNFAYKQNIGPWFVVFPFLAIFLVTTITVGLQVLKTARVNPAETLRYE